MNGRPFSGLDGTHPALEQRWALERAGLRLSRRVRGSIGDVRWRRWNVQTACEFGIEDLWARFRTHFVVPNAKHRLRRSFRVKLRVGTNLCPSRDPIPDPPSRRPPRIPRSRRCLHLEMRHERKASLKLDRRSRPNQASRSISREKARGLESSGSHYSIPILRPP